MLIVFGSINADLLFRVERLPRPGETVLCPAYSFAPGGKGANQAAAAARAGAEVEFVGTVGPDPYGELLAGALARSGAGTTLLARGTLPTGLAVIGVDDGGENAIMVASGANRETRAEQVPDSRLGPGVTVLCQNEVDISQSSALLSRARARGARTILNLAPASRPAAELLAILDVLVVNRLELETVAGAGDPERVAAALAARHGTTVVVTLGAAGALAVTPQGRLRVPSLLVDAVDTTGAGDAFVGVLAAMLDEGRDLGEALRWASVAAGLTCTAVGAQEAQPAREAIAARLGDLG